MLEQNCGALSPGLPYVAARAVSDRLLLRSAADRKQNSGLAGKAARMTHDYKRNGTTSLYAALVRKKALKNKDTSETLH